MKSLTARERFFSLNRRQFVRLGAAAPLAFQAPGCRQPEYAGGLTDLEGIRVGHFTSSKRPTGCTVVLAEEGAVAGVDVRGSAPGTHETDLLNPINTIQQIHGVLLSGGSAFALDAVGGVVQYLEEKKIGVDTGDIKVPIVPAAILYDLGIGDPKIRPDRSSAYLACIKATSGPVPEGTVGVGTGATVGKLLGRELAMKGGLGSASLKVGDLIVAALVAVNGVGDVIDPKTGRILAGARKKEGGFLNISETLKTRPPQGRLLESTTLAVVATNASFDKAGMTKIAQMSQDGFARAINPVHTPYDGDTVFALSTATLDGADLAHVGALAAEVTASAIVRGVMTATGLPHYPAACEL